MLPTLVETPPLEEDPSLVDQARVVQKDILLAEAPSLAEARVILLTEAPSLVDPSLTVKDRTTMMARKGNVLMLGPAKRKYHYRENENPPRPGLWAVKTDGEPEVIHKQELTELSNELPCGIIIR